MNSPKPSRSSPRPSGTSVSSIVIVLSFTQELLEGLQHDEPHSVGHYEADGKDEAVVAREIGTQHDDTPSSLLYMMNGVGRRHMALAFIPYIP